MSDDDLRDERDHWIGEAKRYERLYRGRDAEGTRWYSRYETATARANAAEARHVALVAAVEALRDEFLDLYPATPTDCALIDVGECLRAILAEHGRADA